MKKEIIIDERDNNSEAATIKVNYRMSEAGNIQLIECQVDANYSKPSWLQSYSFNFNSIKNEEHYSLLFEDLKFNRNLETIEFMDNLYASIMRKNNLSYDL